MGAREVGPVRVLVVIDSLGQGGAEESLLATLPRMADLGVDPEVVLLRSAEPGREQRLRDTGVGVQVLEAAGPVAVARALRPVLVHRRPDVLHVTLFDPIVGGALAARGIGAAVLASQTSTPPGFGGQEADSSGAPWKVKLAQRAEAFVCRRVVDHVHAVTPGVRQAVAATYRVPLGRITVAERGRDPVRFAPPTAAERAAVRAELGFDDEAVVAVALGRHEPSKAFGDLVEAIRLAARRVPELHLVLAGREGTDSSRLRRTIAEADLGGRVHLLGVRPDPERVLGGGDLFVLASRREGTSGAMIEAMACGRPAVVTELAGLAGIAVDGENARVVPVGAPDRLADAIAELTADPALARRLAEGGRRTFLDRFTIERSAAALADLYRSVASGTSS